MSLPIDTKQISTGTRHISSPHGQERGPGLVRSGCQNMRQKDRFQWRDRPRLVTGAIEIGCSAWVS